MAEYQSEIRASVLLELEERVAKSKYDKYLKRLMMKRVRSFTDREVSFDFPVTALVGPNGGGKTTILGAAGLAYENVQPRRFFSKSGQYDASMADWAIAYDIIDRSTSRVTVQRTASFPKFKWNRHGLERDVLIFGVARTVPASERRELSRAATSQFQAKDEVPISVPVAEAVEGILGKKIEGYSSLHVDAAGKVTLFSGQTDAGDQYSEFHFGAGEASVIRMVSGIESAATNCLVLIEEIENGLHPVATRRMVEYLIDVARRKSAQVIFTTHSNDALGPLPPRAIWAAYGGNVLQGKLDINALRTITGQIEASLAIFVEDDFAALMTLAALRHYGGLELETIKVHGMGGADPAVRVNEQHNVDPTRRFPSVGLVDGDRKDLVDAAKSVYALPGDRAPEAYVFDKILDRIDELAARLTVSMQLPSGRQEQVKKVVRERASMSRSAKNSTSPPDTPSRQRS